MCCFFLNCSDWQSHCSVFLILKFEHSFMKNLTYFVRLLPVACFCDSFETRIINFLRATDIPVCFLSASVFWLFYFLEYFNITKRFKKHEFDVVCFAW